MKTRIQIEILIKQTLSKVELYRNKAINDLKKFDTEITKKIIQDDITDYHSKNILKIENTLTGIKMNGHKAARMMRAIKAANNVLRHLQNLHTNSISIQNAQWSYAPNLSENNLRVIEELIPAIATVIYSTDKLCLNGNKEFVDFVYNNIDKDFVTKCKNGERVDIAFIKQTEKLLPDTTEVMEHVGLLFQRILNEVNLSNVNEIHKQEQSDNKQKSSMLKDILEGKSILAKSQAEQSNLDIEENPSDLKRQRSKSEQIPKPDSNQIEMSK